jgi:hypothetical protein
MKKVFRMSALAILVLGLATACKQKVEETVDSVIDTMPTIEEVADTLTEEVAEVAEPVATEPVKKAVKKAETKKVDPTSKEANPVTPVQSADKPAAPSLRDQKKMQETAAKQKVDNNGGSLRNAARSKEAAENNTKK